jgi:hypothetical protein
MLGLLPDHVEVVIQGRMTRILDPVRQEIDRLTALYDGFHDRELARILFVKLGDPVDDKTVKKLWQQSPVSCQGRLGLWDYHRHPDRYQARLEVVKLYYHGWEKLSISRFLRVSRPTVDLAGAIAPTAATWVALMVLYTACTRYGAPETLVSDSGGAYTSNDFEAVCARLQIQHETIESTTGESYQNLMETHLNIQRRLYDYQFSLARTPAALAQVHQVFIQTDNTTAHQGLLHDQRLPPMPVEVLGEAKGRSYPPDDLARRFSHALFPRVTNRHGCVTLPSDHFDVEAGLPRT